MSSGLLLIQGWSEHLVAAGFILLLLAAQLLQFKLIWRPVDLKVEGLDAICGATEIEMPEDLRRFFATGSDAKARVIA